MALLFRCHHQQQRLLMWLLLRACLQSHFGVKLFALKPSFFFKTRFLL